MDANHTVNTRFRSALAHARALKEQREAKNVCTCCHQPSAKLVKDHNHESNLWRGMVCYSCNALIGYVEWTLQHPDKTEQIVAYLKQYDPEHKLVVNGK